MNFQGLFQSLGHSMDEVTPLSGGDINQVFLVNETVVKVNSAADFPKMFLKEANGLNKLSAHISTPKVLETGEHEGLQFLRLERVTEGSKSVDFWTQFGIDLANLHSESSASFGLNEANFIGSLVQTNQEHADWKDFLVQERLQPMIEMAVNGGDVNYVEAKIIENFYNRIDEIYPKEPPALLHGDLWAGNFICGKDGCAWLIDPAVYFGHREMDLGMIHLFGGFENSLFDAYNEKYPLEKTWKSRIQINQLYPLLVHVNLFGRSYWAKVSEILKPFSK